MKLAGKISIIRLWPLLAIKAVMLVFNNKLLMVQSEIEAFGQFVFGNFLILRKVLRPFRKRKANFSRSLKEYP